RKRANRAANENAAKSTATRFLCAFIAVHVAANWKGRMLARRGDKKRLELRALEPFARQGAQCGLGRTDFTKPPRDNLCHIEPPFAHACTPLHASAGNAHRSLRHPSGGGVFALSLLSQRHQMELS